jgi:predicted metalloprotease with PDZ domain
MTSRLCLLATIIALGCLLPGAAAQQQLPPGIEYTLTLDQPHTQFVSVSMLLRDVRGEHVDVMLPAWRPGRYVIMNQAAAIRDVWAGGDDQQPLHVDKVDKTTWRVRLNGSRSLRFNYDVYCNSLNDRMRHVDDTHAFLDGAAVFTIGRSPAALM